MNNFEEKIKLEYGVDVEIFWEAIRSSPSAHGYTLGAISEVLLKLYCENNNYEVLRIKEKPAGGNKAKSDEARGDFYIRKKGSNDKWYVLECKGLKSNSEFRGSKLDNKDKLYRFLKNIAFADKKKVYKKGLSTYTKAKNKWKKKHRRKIFPSFNWTKDYPGPISYTLDNLWKNADDLKKWINSLDNALFTEKAYRETKGAIAILETHKPSKRVCSLTKINQAAPLVSDFSILAIDTYLRTKEHKFVFVNPQVISHSPSSPSHLYQNYTIDILVKGKKEQMDIKHPWYLDIDECILKTHPDKRNLDSTQLDTR